MPSELRRPCCLLKQHLRFTETRRICRCRNALQPDAPPLCPVRGTLEGLAQAPALLETLERLLTAPFPAPVPLPAGGLLLLVTRVLSMDDVVHSSGMANAASSLADAGLFKTDPALAPDIRCALPSSPQTAHLRQLLYHRLSASWSACTSTRGGQAATCTGDSANGVACPAFTCHISIVTHCCGYKQFMGAAVVNVDP